MANKSMSKILVIVGSALLVAGTVPAVLAHPDSGGGFYGTSVGSESVAGNVVGSSGVTLTNQGGDQWAASAIGGCDFEVLDPDGMERPGVETMIDGVFTNGSQPDNTWDDGGQGVVCHTNVYTNQTATVHNESWWNTEGCGERADHGHAVANALVGALPVFVAATCDLGTQQSTTFNPATDGVTAGVCLANGVLGSGQVDVSCINNWLGGSGTSGWASCALDSSSDDTNYGYASGGSTVPVPTKTETQTAIGSSGTVSDCSDTAGATAILVFENVVDLSGATPSVSGPASTEVWTFGQR